MTYRLEFLPDAIFDIEEAFLWYQAVSSKLSGRFQGQLEISINDIYSNPLAYHSLKSIVRCKRLKRFPYLIIFAVREDLISVIAIIHEKRNPKIWKQRIKKK